MRLTVAGPPLPGRLGRATKHSRPRAGHSPASRVTAAVVTGTVEAGVVALLGLAAALRARRALRRLPSVGAAAAGALAQNG